LSKDRSSFCRRDEKKQCFDKFSTNGVFERWRLAQ